jgi:UDP-3-O-[3-hydroxymyristoyl] glucosamine N-acyltransferase
MNNNIFFNHSDLKSFGQNSIIGKTVRIRNPELVSIGYNVIIDDFTYISGKISIGDYVHIGDFCSLQGSNSEIVMGDFSALASGVRAFATSADYINCSFNTATVAESKQF